MLEPSRLAYWSRRSTPYGPSGRNTRVVHRHLLPRAHSFCGKQRERSKMQQSSPLDSIDRRVARFLPLRVRGNNRDEIENLWTVESPLQTKLEAWKLELGIQASGLRVELSSVIVDSHVRHVPGSHMKSGRDFP